VRTSFLVKLTKVFCVATDKVIVAIMSLKRSKHEKLNHGTGFIFSKLRLIP